MRKLLFLFILSWLLSSPILSGSGSEEVWLSCSLEPLNIEIRTDGSIRATYDLDDSDNDNEKIFTDPEPSIWGTGSCSTRSWIITYLDINYQVSEIGCTPGGLNIPEGASAELIVGGERLSSSFGPYLGGGSKFWCF